MSTSFWYFSLLFDGHWIFLQGFKGLANITHQDVGSHLTFFSSQIDFNVTRCHLKTNYTAHLFPFFLKCGTLECVSLCLHALKWPRQLEEVWLNPSASLTVIGSFPNHIMCEGLGPRGQLCVRQSYQNYQPRHFLSLPLFVLGHSFYFIFAGLNVNDSQH